MRILVTGGAGFIGSNFLRLAFDGTFKGIDSVKVLDKLTYAGVLANIEKLTSHKNFEFILNMFIDRHCHCEFSMTIKNNIKSYYTKIHKFNENMDVNDTYPPDNIFPRRLTDIRIKSRVIDFVFILREIEVIKKFQLSTLIFLFQYLIGIEFISFVIPSCRGYT